MTELSWDDRGEKKYAVMRMQNRGPPTTALIRLNKNFTRIDEGEVLQICEIFLVASLADNDTDNERLCGLE